MLGTASYWASSSQSSEYMAKEEVGRFPEICNPGIAGRDQSTRSPGTVRAPVALAALGQEPCP